jgi:hypothetical protein
MNAARLKANPLFWAKAQHRALRAGKCTSNLLQCKANVLPLEEHQNLMMHLLFETLMLPQK